MNDAQIKRVIRLVGNMNRLGTTILSVLTAPTVGSPAAASSSAVAVPAKRAAKKAAKRAAKKAAKRAAKKAAAKKAATTAAHTA